MYKFYISQLLLRRGCKSYLQRNSRIIVDVICDLRFVATTESLKVQTSSLVLLAKNEWFTILNDVCSKYFSSI